MEILLGLAIGIASGYFGSMLFLRHYLHNRRPVVEISDKIAYSYHTKEKEYYYYFKLVNKTDFDILDVRCELSFMKSENSLNGQNLVGEDISLNDSIIFHIDKKNKNDKNALHALRVYCRQDLEAEWDARGNGATLNLKVIAKHSLTGLTSVFIQQFFGKQDIIKGEFEHGDSLKVGSK